MSKVRPKKHLGQHFLMDEDVASNIVNALTVAPESNVLEIGPGTGVLTKYLVKNYTNFKVIDIDQESIQYLQKFFPELEGNIISGDFLKMDLSELNRPVSVIGNFPYNISSQIFFQVLEYKDDIPCVVGMLQKEVAERLASPPGKKAYGILSVLLQAYYTIEYLFTVPPNVFHPPPKVNSGVIRLKRNDVLSLDCDEKLFKRVIKQGFQNRRKTLWNALKPLNLPDTLREEVYFSKRAEQLSVEDFVSLTNLIDNNRENTSI